MTNESWYVGTVNKASLVISTWRSNQTGRQFTGNIFKWTFSRKMLPSSSKFHWSWFIRVQYIYKSILVPSGDGLAPNMHQAITATIQIQLTHWGRVTHICVSKLTILGSDNGLSPEKRQVIICTNAGLLLIGPLGTNFSEILIKLLTFSSQKMRLKVLSVKRRPFCLSLNVLTHSDRDKMAIIYQSTFSNAFSWMEMYELPLRFHWNVF